MEWRRVQEERPSCSTSGGQSLGGPTGTFMDFLADVKSERELHVRQLYNSISNAHCGVGRTYGLPSFPSIIRFLGGAVGAGVGAPTFSVSLVSSDMSFCLYGDEYIHLEETKPEMVYEVVSSFGVAHLSVTRQAEQTPPAPRLSERDTRINQRCYHHVQFSLFRRWQDSRISTEN